MSSMASYPTGLAGHSSDYMDPFHNEYEEINKADERRKTFVEVITTDGVSEPSKLICL